MEIAYFKRPQRPNIYHYFKVYGGPGKTKNGYQEVLNFLNQIPIISVEKNYVNDTSGLTGTWCTYEVGITITNEEYNQAFKNATANQFKIY